MIARVRSHDSRRIALVTGASGFVGGHTLDALVQRGFEVHAVSRGANAIPAPGIVWHRADLLDPESARDVVHTVAPSHLMHLAWCTTPGAYWSSPENVDWVRASTTLLELFVRSGGRRAILVGTCAEYDWRYGFCSEAVTPVAPATVYGRAKHTFHLAVQGAGELAPHDCAWARLFFLYGPREHPARLVPSVIRHLRSGEPFRATHGRQIRDYMHVLDAATALATVMDSDLGGDINIASGEPTTVRHVIEHLADRLARPELIEFGAVTADDAPCVLGDTSRLREELGWAPKYSLRDGLDQTLSWWTDAASAGALR